MTRTTSSGRAASPRRPDGRPPRPAHCGGAAMLLIAASHAQGFGSCPMSRMSKASIALVMVEWLEARGSRNSMACRRIAPPGFRAAPRAVFAVTAIRLQSLTPSRLRALRAALASRGKPCGLSPPRAAWRPSMPPNRLRRIGPAIAPPRGRSDGEHADTCCGRLCGCVPSSTLAVPAHHVTKDSSRTTRPASLWSFHATPQNLRRKV